MDDPERRRGADEQGQEVGGRADAAEVQDHGRAAVLTESEAFGRAGRGALAQGDGRHAGLHRRIEAFEPGHGGDGVLADPVEPVDPRHHGETGDTKPLDLTGALNREIATHLGAQDLGGQSTEGDLVGGCREAAAKDLRGQVSLDGVHPCHADRRGVHPGLDRAVEHQCGDVGVVLEAGSDLVGDDIASGSVDQVEVVAEAIPVGDQPPQARAEHDSADEDCGHYEHPRHRGSHRSPVALAAGEGEPKPCRHGRGDAAARNRLDER